MVRSTNYRGDVKITFPVANRQVVLAPNSLVCQMRYGPARWFFYVTFLWLLTWPVLWVWTRRWDVVDARFQTVEGVEGRWVDRWGWVVTRMVRQRRSKRDPLTDDNLRWIECHEIMSDEERDRRSNVGGIQGWFGGFLSRIGDVRENSGEWGVHDW